MYIYNDFSLDSDKSCDMLGSNMSGAEAFGIQGTTDRLRMEMCP